MGISAVRALAVVTPCSLLLFACGRSVPEPRLAPQPDEAFTRVPYPPPPARVERLPSRPPQPDAVWVDGQWLWDGQRWAWSAGKWVLEPRGGSFARWELRLMVDGRLEFAPPSWRDASGHKLPPPQILKAAIGEEYGTGRAVGCP